MSSSPDERPQVNNGFWDLTPEDRAAAMNRATDNGDKGNFFDLTPEERARAYDWNPYDERR